MNAKYGIGFLAAIIACIAIFSGAYYFSYQNLKQQQAEVKAEQEAAEQKKAEEQARLDEEQAIATEGEASQAFQFYLYPLNGYVVVYLSDKTTVYEYTNIAVEHLPDNVQTDIEDGKGISTEEELYGFLENYSS